jgi:hypothetical protein
VDAIAIIATIGGFVVAIAGLIANVVIAKLQRGQALELAEKAHAHERELARGDRLYESRTQVYEAMMKTVHAIREHVEATEPTSSRVDPKQLPPLPSPDENRALYARLRTYGSLAVAEAMDHFLMEARRFFGDETSEIQEVRKSVLEAVWDIERLVSEELATL